MKARLQSVCVLLQSNCIKFCGGLSEFLIQMYEVLVGLCGIDGNRSFPQFITVNCQVITNTLHVNTNLTPFTCKQIIV